MRHWNSRTQPWSTTAREIAEALQKDFPLKDLCWSLSNQTTMQCLIQECNQILFDPWMFWNSEGRKLCREAGQKRDMTGPGMDLNSLPIMKLKCLNQPIPKFASPSDPFLMFPGSDGFMNPADAWDVFTGCSTISSRQNQSIDVGLLPRCQSKKCLPPETWGVGKWNLSARDVAVLCQSNRQTGLAPLDQQYSSRSLGNNNATAMNNYSIIIYYSSMIQYDY